MTKAQPVVTSEEKRFNRNIKNRRTGLILNVVGSSSLILLLLILTILLAVAIIGVEKFIIPKIAESLEGTVTTKLHDLIEQAQKQTLSREAMSADEIYNKIIESIKAGDVKLPNGSILTIDKVKKLSNDLLKKEDVITMINQALNNEPITLPDSLSINFVNNLAKEFNIGKYMMFVKIGLIVCAYLAIINLLNMIFASRLIVVKGKISKPLFIITSVLSINLLNWIGTLVYVTSDKKEVA